MFRRKKPSLKERLSAKILQKIKKQNQPITIRDIHVYSEPDQSYGEAGEYSNIHTDYPSVPRLIDHVESLAKMANLYHEKYYCKKNKTGHYEIKPNCLNKITRLSLNEFSLYTKQPMIMEDFVLLVDAIDAIAKNQHENVHLLLSSVSLITSNNEILNMSLYVQCGADPKINIFSKAHSHAMDVQYPRTINFSQQATPNKNEKSQPVNSSSFILSETGYAISNNTVFTVQTQSGAEYLQAVDVCEDHNKSHAKTLIAQASGTPGVNETVLYPEQADHLVTSDTAFIRDHSKITAFTAQVDPRRSPLQTQHMNRDAVHIADLQSVQKNKYSNMSIEAIKGPRKMRLPILHRETKEKITYSFSNVEVETGGFKIKNPPFGSDYYLVAQDERKLGGLIGELQQIVKQHNQVAKEKIVASQLSTLVSHETEEDKPQSKPHL